MSDHDGWSSATQIILFLRQLNSNSVYFIHSGKQHGISKDVWKDIKQSNLDLLIMPDAATNDVKQTDWLVSHGTQVLILDHHEIEVSNQNAIIVNHHLSDNLNHNLSGAGVTNKFIQAYCEKYNITMPYFEDLVASSIVSDICDLTSNENRLYLNQGLESIDSIQNPFLKALFEEYARSETTPKDVSFSVVPKINALSRLDNMEWKQIAFSAMIGETTTDEALPIVKKAYNEQNKIVKHIVLNLEIDESHKCIIVSVDPEYANFTGLIANRLVGQYGKPSMVLREHEDGKHYSGSMRSPIDTLSIINQSNLAECRGHERAHGVFIDRDKVQDLIEWFDATDLDFNPPIQVTGELNTKLITLSLASQCFNNKHLWGEGLPQPKFYIKEKFNGNYTKVFEKRTTTIKLPIKGIDFMLFRAKEEDVDALTSSNSKTIEMIVSLEINEFRGNRTPQCIIENYEVCDNVPSADWRDIF